jgi:hypothetical protein
LWVGLWVRKPALKGVMNLQCVRKLCTISRAARTILLGCISLSASLTLFASTVTVTVEGTVSGGDQYGIFGVGKDLKGQEFTLVFTFDDANVRKIEGDQCDAPHSEGKGSNPSSPAKAVLTIGKGSFTFGNQGNSEWAVSRTLASSCSGSMVGMFIHEGVYPQTEGFDLRLFPAQAKIPLIRSLDWHSPFAATGYDNNPENGVFVISHPRDFMRLTKGYLFVKSVTVQ